MSHMPNDDRFIHLQENRSMFGFFFWMQKKRMSQQCKIQGTDWNLWGFIFLWSCVGCFFVFLFFSLYFRTVVFVMPLTFEMLEATSCNCVFKKTSAIDKLQLFESIGEQGGIGHQRSQFVYTFALSRFCSLSLVCMMHLRVCAIMLQPDRSSTD